MTAHQLEHLEDLVAPRHNGWQRQVTANWRGHKIRARVVRDWYHPQCEFTADVWSPATLTWNRVQTLPPQSVFDANDRAWKRSLDAFADPSADPYALTQGVVDELLAYAQEVLS